MVGVWIVEEGNKVVSHVVMRIIFVLLKRLSPARSPDISRSIITVSFFLSLLAFLHTCLVLFLDLCDLCLLLSFFSHFVTS